MRVLIIGKPKKGFSALDDLSNPLGYCGSSSPLSQWVALLALKSHRAPRPLSSGLQKALQKALIRQGIVDDVELVDIARRSLFLRDARMLLAEFRKRPILISRSFEFDKSLSTETQTQSETGVRYQCP